MQMFEDVKLIAEAPQTHGVFEAPEETERTVVGEILSISANEMYTAMAAGFAPEMRVKLAHWKEYEGEAVAECRGKRYYILRAYTTPDEHIELTLARRVNSGV